MSIASFTNSLLPATSGDPNRMVLYGQSAGSTAVLSQAYAYPEKPIVRGFIASSAGIGTTNPTNTTLFHDLAQTAGCANFTGAAELDCMQKIDAPELQRKVNEANTDPNRGVFRPIADGVSLFANLTERLEKGLVAKLVRSQTLVPPEGTSACVAAQGIARLTRNTFSRGCSH